MYLRRGCLAASNAELVADAADLVRTLGRCRRDGRRGTRDPARVAFPSSTVPARSQHPDSPSMARASRAHRPPTSRSSRADAGSHALRKEAERVLAGGVSSHFKAWQPFYVREARAAHLTDVDGNDYVDLVMGFGPNPLGHSPEAVIAAVRATLGDGTSLAIATPLEVGLAQTISRLVPSMELMRFVVTGTEATMMALRTARAFTGRTRIARFEGHYHGQHDAALVSVAHVAGPRAWPEPVADGAGFPRACSTTSSSCPGTTSTRWRRWSVRPTDLAAVILEPIPFSNIGGEEPDPEFLRALRELTWEQRCPARLRRGDHRLPSRPRRRGCSVRIRARPALLRKGGRRWLPRRGLRRPAGRDGGCRATEARRSPSAETIFQSGTFSGTPPAMAAGIAMLRRARANGCARGGQRARRDDPSGMAGLIGGVGLAAQVTGMSSWLGIYFTARRIRTSVTCSPPTAQRQRAFSLGLLAGGVYLPPSHPGFTSAAHSSGTSGRARRLRAGARELPRPEAVSTRLPVA